jgi:hypothetical protein
MQEAKTKVKKQNQFEMSFVKTEVFTAVTIKNAVSWDVAPCTSCVPPKRLFTQDRHGSTYQETAFLKALLACFSSLEKMKVGL